MSLYRSSIHPLIGGLRNLSGLLDKGKKFADEKGMPYEEMLNFRLAPDMRGLTYQVTSCCNTSKWIPVRLGLMENVVFADDETTFDQLHERITKTIELLQTIDEQKLNVVQNEPMIMKTGMGAFKFETGQAYVWDFALPNFNFHLGTAYCILRHLGVPVGAIDYLGKDTFIKVDS